MAPLIPVLEVIDFRRAPYRHRAAVPIPQQHIKTAFKARGQARVPKAPRQPTVAAARRPRTQPSPCAAGVSARSQSRNARASGFSPDPGATGRKQRAGAATGGSNSSTNVPRSRQGATSRE